MARFETTRWSLVLAAGQEATERSRKALSSLCESYWYPIYGFIRSRGFDEDEARDMTQAYLATLMEKHYLKGLDPEAGRFRSFLLVSVRNFLANEWDRRKATKRGGGAVPVPLDTEEAERQLSREPSLPTTQEQSFERRWALTVIRRATDALEREFTRYGQADRYHLLRGFLVGDAPTLPYQQLAGELDLSEAGIKSLIHRMRKRFGVLLRGEVLQTVDRSDRVEEEMRYLLQILSRR